MTNLTEAEEYLFNYTKEFARKNFDVEVNVGFLRPQTHRLLGQCNTYDRMIRYNKKFIETHKDKKDILRYIAIHECCHLKYPNHGVDFKMMCLKFGMPRHRLAKIEGYIQTPPSKYYLIECPNCKTEHKQLKFKSNFGACSPCCNKYGGGKYNEEYRFTFIRYVDESKSKVLCSENTY